MTEEEARAWLAALPDVSRETIDRLDRLRAMVVAENERQNLIATSTIDHVWARHITDSAQLVTLAEPDEEPWLDLGTGAGFPGLVVAVMTSRPVHLVESRRKRADFLQHAAIALGLSDTVVVHGARIEALSSIRAAVISARAFAPLPKLFDLAARFSTISTCWVLPKGRSAREELDAVGGTWQGTFRLEPSITDPDAAIIVAKGVARRRKA